jgi:Ca-activated chloride channel family protein
MTFHSPWFLLLLLLVPLVAWRLFNRRKASAVPYSSTKVVSQIGSSLKQRLQWLLPVMTIAVVVLLIFALARPQEGRKQTTIESEGIAIEMIVDRSGSMQAMDFELEGQPVDRLTAVKDVASKFVAGDEKLDTPTDSRRRLWITTICLDNSSEPRSLANAVKTEQRSVMRWPWR